MQYCLRAICLQSSYMLYTCKQYNTWSVSNCRMRLPRSPRRFFTLIEGLYYSVIACKHDRIPASSPNIWFVYNKSTQVEQLLENLLAQGLRESSLKKKLSERVKEMGLLRTLGLQREAVSSGSASSAAPASTASVAGPAVGSTADTTAVDSNAASSSPAAAPSIASSALNTAASSSQPAPLAPKKEADQSALKALSDLFVSVRAHLYSTVLYWENGLCRVLCLLVIRGTCIYSI